MIELMKITLVIAPINEKTYFMPCVLKHCSPKRIEEETSKQTVAPIVIKLPGECIPRGFFCALACSLMSQWKFHRERRKLVDVFKNFIHFDIEGMDCSVAVVDSFYFISMHVFGDCDREGCREILKDVKLSIKTVATKHSYDESLIMSYDKDINFLCLCGEASEHIATLTTRGKLKLKCSMDQPLTLTKKHAVWFNDEQYSNWEQQQSPASTMTTKGTIGRKFCNYITHAVVHFEHAT